MRKSLTNKLKMACAAVGLAGVAGANSGCGALLMAAGAAKGSPGVYALGQGLNSMEAAEAGRSQTNVYVQGNPQMQNLPAQPQPVFYDGPYRGGNYKGPMLNNSPQGCGTQTSSDGIKREAYWKGEIPTGPGKIIFPDGRVKEGVWRLTSKTAEVVNYELLDENSVQDKIREIEERDKAQKAREDEAKKREDTKILGTPRAKTGTKGAK